MGGNPFSVMGYQTLKPGNPQMGYHHRCLIPSLTMDSFMEILMSSDFKFQCTPGHRHCESTY